MAHLDRQDLYALFYALHAHQRGQEPIAGLKLDPDLTGVVERLKADDFKRPPADEHRLSEDDVLKTVRHATKCKDCQLVAYEDGPYAKRRKSVDDLALEASEREEEEKRLSRKFFVSVAYGLAFFIAANWSMAQWRASQHKAEVVDGPTINAVDDGLKIHPMFVVGMICVVIAAWGLADAWRIANQLWLDWTRAKEAVPVVGKRWAARARRKKQEAESGR